MFENIEVRAVDHRWVTSVSFTLQAFGVGLMILIPLIYTDALPLLRVGPPLAVPYAPRRSMEHVDVVSVERHDAPIGQIVNSRLMEPSTIPKSIYTGKDLQGSSDSSTDVIGVPFGDPNGVPNSVNFAHLPVFPEPRPARPAPPPKLVRVSNFESGYLVRRVEPRYPPLAIATRVQGTVELLAVIDTHGNIERLQLLSGHPLLVRAAIDAVRQWKYRPYVLNGSPVEVETHVTVTFTLR